MNSTLGVMRSHASFSTLTAFCLGGKYTTFAENKTKKKDKAHLNKILASPTLINGKLLTCPGLLEYKRLI